MRGVVAREYVREALQPQSPDAPAPESGGGRADAPALPSTRGVAEADGGKPRAEEAHAAPFQGGLGAFIEAKAKAQAQAQAQATAAAATAATPGYGQYDPPYDECRALQPTPVPAYAAALGLGHADVARYEALWADAGGSGHGHGRDENHCTLPAADAVAFLSTSRLASHEVGKVWALAYTEQVRVVSRSIPPQPNGGQFDDFARSSARTPHGAYV